ncbi:MAG: hypothetical protein L3J72_04770, partial [Thermoplasmata archaeon]|nr:hypothetical protein [Thermoplasmata archaeon]
PLVATLPLLLPPTDVAVVPLPLVVVERVELLAPNSVLALELPLPLEPLLLPMLPPLPPIGPDRPLAQLLHAANVRPRTNAVG